MFNKQILICTLMVALMLACTFANAQTCKTKTPNFEPSYCTQCTTCSSSAKSSCCDANMDASAATAVALFTKAGAPGSCIEFAKEYSCAFCDPKNQDLFSISNAGIISMNMCKSKCKTMESSCGLDFTKFIGASCDSLPETNCWSSANSLGAHVMVALILSLITFFMF